MSPNSVGLSIAFHVLLVVALLTGLPQLWQRQIEPQPTIMVEVFTLSDQVAAPVPQLKPEPEVEPEAPPEVAEPQPEPPQPEEQVLAALPTPEPLPLPEVEPLPEPEAAPEPVLLPEPEPLPEPVPVPEPEVVQPEPEPAPPAEAAAPVPSSKPTPPDKPQQQTTDFSSVMDSLLLDRSAQEAQPQPQTEAPSTSFDDVAASIASASNAPVSNEALATIASLIAQQIAKHWNIPAGAEGAERLKVRLDVSLSQDGRVLSASVIEVIGESPDSFKRAAREAAERAVYYFRDHPFLGLPLDQYDVWRRMIVTFDPSQMLRT